jgi:hypothetical protein
MGTPLYVYAECCFGMQLFTLLHSTTVHNLALSWLRFVNKTAEYDDDDEEGNVDHGPLNEGAVGKKKGELKHLIVVSMFCLQRPRVVHALRLDQNKF